MITERQPAITKEEVRALWRDDERERKRSDNYRAYKLLRKDIKERLKNGEKLSHRKQWVGRLPEFPIYADREGSFQVDCMFMPPFNHYVGIVCVVSVDRKIAWAEAWKGGNPEAGGQKTKRISAKAMIPYFLKCVAEIDKRFHVKVQRVESDDETMFKGDFQREMEVQGIHWYFVKPSISGPLKTKVGIVERFNRTLKSILNKLIDQYELRQTDWVNLLPEALHQYNYENVHREIGMTPSDTNEDQEKAFVHRKVEQTHNTQVWWDAEVNGRTQARIPNEENLKDPFKKEKKRYLRGLYTLDKRAAGPSLTVTSNETGEPIPRRFLPYDVSWI